MKLHIVSDLHISVAGFELPATDADLIVLAGDIARPAQALEWAVTLGKPVLYVAGNHEFYGGSIDGTLRELRRLSRRSNVRFLDNDEVVIDGVRFLGCTLWTDFLLFGPGQGRDIAVAQSLAFIRDFSRIRASEHSERAFAPDDAAALFEGHARWLEDRLGTPHRGPTVVITHHAPSRQSIHPRFADSPINACFISDAERLCGADRVQLWIHGHTHDSFDYEVEGTRVLCNPRGYAKDGVNENAGFAPDLVVRVNTG